MSARRILAGLLLAVAACARTSGTVEIPRKDLPFSVSRTDESAQTRTPGRRHDVYFVRGDRLVQTQRREASDRRPPETALRALLRGPTVGERAAGISTEIPSAVRLLALRVSGDEARVDLSGEFQEPSAPKGIVLRVAQVVWTLTALPQIRSVAFSIDGEPVAVTTEDETAVERPVRREDYATLSPR